MENNPLDRKGILYLLLIASMGSIFRVIYGVYFHFWENSPDHIAWELSIKNGGWSYLYLIHYPHEGGTIPISILSKLSHLLGASSPLLIVSTFLDFIARLIQLLVVKKVANKTVFWCFAIWSVFGSVTTLPWGMMTFGLHSISSVFPFLLLLVIANKEIVNNYSWQIGLVAALSYWFSYTNAMLVLVFIAFIFIKPYSQKVRLRFTIGFIATILIYFLVVYRFNAGFELTNPNPFFPRDTSVGSFAFDFSKIYEFWSYTLGASFVTERSSFLISWLSFIFTAGILLNFKTFNKDRDFLYVLLFIVGFGLIYSLSPYFASENQFHFMNFRHLSYLIPVAVYLTIGGWQKLFKKYFLAPALIVFVLIGNSVYSFTNKVDIINHEEVTGWVLANKFGKHPEKVKALIDGEVNPDRYYIGIGWGTAASIFHSSTAGELQSKVDILLSLKSKYPVEFQDEFMEGVEFAFHENITPKLDIEILPKILVLTKGEN